MLWLVDALVILLLAGVGFAAASPSALPAVLWLAFATPTLVRVDLAERRLPNRLTLPAVGIVAGQALAGIVLEPWAQRSVAVLVAITSTAVAGWLVARTGAVGLGDVKLATALIGSLVLAAGSHPSCSVGIFVVEAAGGGSLAAVVTVVWSGRVRRRHCGRRRSHARSRPSVPFGPWLLLGYWSALAVDVFA